jgi:hypothetical protein
MFSRVYVWPSRCAAKEYDFKTIVLYSKDRIWESRMRTAVRFDARKRRSSAKETKHNQPSKNNNGKDDSMNSTTEIPETAHAFDPRTFSVVPARTFEDLRVGEIFRAPSRTLTDAHASLPGRFG